MKLLKKLLPLLLIISIIFSMVSCVQFSIIFGGDNREDENNENSNSGDDANTQTQFSTYTVTVKNPLGNPLSGVTVFIHKDAGADYNVCTAPVVTNKEGKATFTLDTAFTYSIQLSNLPSVYTALSGYTPDERYQFTSTEAIISLEYKVGAVPASYKVGDPIANFTISDINGSEYELYEVLKQKKMVMLNFWFCNCGPCASEFPSLNSAYNVNKNLIEVFAINDTPEPVSSVISYAVNKGLSMPVFKLGQDSPITADQFSDSAYPTTVVIDRYGMIAFVHTGAVTSVSAWNELFEYFTSDSYISGEEYIINDSLPPIGDNDPEDNTEPETATYTVTVTNPFGKPVSDVTVYIHKDGGEDYNVCTTPAVTDDEGKVSFTLDTAFTYSVQVASIPLVYSALSGYTPQERYQFTSGEATVILGYNEGATPSSYDVGDPIANFTLTDIDGNEYKLSELLKTKKMVMLNFWFYKCYPCAAEFPALNAAYNTYSDKIEVLAVNDCDSISYVKGYESYRGFTLDMPLFCVGYDTAVSNERFGAQGWPTTVIIDRYGIVSYIHVGAVTSTSAWNELFEYYTSDSYNGESYKAN